MHNLQDLQHSQAATTPRTRAGLAGLSGPASLAGLTGLAALTGLAGLAALPRLAGLATLLGLQDSQDLHGM